MDAAVGRSTDRSPGAAPGEASSEGPARGRGRPPHSAEVVEQRRNEIIAAAYDVFAEKGYHATGIADIAARLDIGHGTFYRYFANKRDIFEHVVGFAATRLVTSVLPAGLPEARTREELRGQLTDLGNRFLAEALDNDPRLAQLVLLEATGIDSDLVGQVLGMLESLTGAMVPMLDNGVSRGFLRTDLDVAMTARAATGFVFAALLSVVRNPLSGADRDAWVATVVSMIVDNTAPEASR